MMYRAAFDLSYRALPEGLARVYRLVAEHPGPDFSAEIAAATGLPDDQAEDGLQALVDASMVEEIDEGRYRFHDLMRLYARTQADDDREGARRRIGDWFLHWMTRANVVVIPNRWRISPVCEQYRDVTPLFADGGAAIAWLDRHLPHTMAVLDDAVARGWDELAWQVCEALWELFLYRKHYREWIRSHELGITAAARCGHQEAESRLRCQLGRAFLDLHRFDDAERECLRALELARRARSRRNESVALDQLGMVAQSRGDVDTAADHFQESLLIEQELGIERGVALRHRRIGDVLLDGGRDSQAGLHLRRASEMSATLSDVKAQARVEVGLARIDARAGEIDRAVWRLNTPLDTFRTSGSAVYQVEVLLVLAQITIDNGDREAARPYLSQALELCHEVGGPHLEQVRARLAALDGCD